MAVEALTFFLSFFGLGGSGGFAYGPLSRRFDTEFHFLEGLRCTEILMFAISLSS